MSSSNKRYYWLKLKENFFEDDTIQWLEEQENGKEYVIFYLKLALKSLNDNGRLVRYVGETLLPYDVKALSKLTNTSPDTVAVAMKVFIDIGLVSRLDGGEIYMNQIDEMVGSETLGAEKMRRLRAEKNAKKQIENTNCNNVTECYSELLEIEKEKDIEKDKELQQEAINKNEEKEKNDSGGELPLSKNVFRAWENLWMFPNLVQKEILVELSEKYSDELVVAAIKVAGANDVIKGRAINFIEAVLKEWEDNNIETIEQAREYTKNRNKVKGNRNYNKRNRKKETLPDWATKETTQTQADEVVNSNLGSRLEELRKMRDEE